MKINVFIRVIAAVLAVIWMFRIFSFSSAPATESMQTSRSVSFDLVSSFSDLLCLDWDEDRINGVARSIEKAVRKLAHMAEFAVLGTLVGIACDAWRGPFIRSVIAFLICLIYAVSDELHQTFVDGRSGEIKDVCIDVSGALLALVLIALIVRVAKRRSWISSS